MLNKNIANENINEIMEQMYSSCKKKCCNCSHFSSCGKCPIANPQHCCTVIIEHKTCLVPPAEDNCSVKHTVSIEAVIEKVCPGKVLICGVLHKKIRYTTIRQCEKLDSCFIKYDDVPFQCCVDADEANEDDIYEIVGCDIVCTNGKAVNEGCHPCTCKRVFWGYEEKDIIKIAVKRCALNFFC